MLYNKTSMFGTSSLVGRAAAVFALVTLLAFFFGPFYWPGSNAAWASFLRFSVLISVILYCFVRGERFRLNSLGVVTLLFLSYLMLNSLIHGEMQSARRLVFIAFFVFMVANFWREPMLPGLLLGMITLLGTLFAAFSLFNLYRLGELSLSYREGAIFYSGQAGVADFGNTIVAAMHYAACYCAALWMLINSTKRLSSIIWTVSSVFIGVYIVMTFARTGWMACLISSIILFALAVRSDGWRRMLPIIIALAALLTWFSFQYLGYELQVRGVTHRDEIWLTVLHRMESDFIWGYGAGSKFDPISISGGQVYVNTAHSAYMEVLYQFGLVGLLLMLAVLGMALKELLRSSPSQRREGQEAFGLALLASAAVVMLVELNGFVDSPNLLWIWFWLPLGVALSSQRGESHVEN